MNRLSLSILLTVIAISPIQTSVWGTHAEWTHFTIESPLPGKDWGTGGTSLGDFDGDGDLDMALSRRHAHVFVWYERCSDSKWQRHLLSDSPDLKQGLGSTALDIDHDGHLDIAFEQVWFQNPGTLGNDRDANWATHTYPGGGHDILAADIDGDQQADLITFDGQKLLAFITGEVPLTAITLADGFDHHGGLTPRGAGDLDGDGDNDLVIAGIWFENPGDVTAQWDQHKWPHEPIPAASYGTSIRSYVIDVDEDGNTDIVYSDCDTSQAHVFWVRNLGKGEHWQRIQLPDPAVAEGDVPGTGSFHSLAVADFNGDGKLEIFAGEQEDPNQYMVKDGKLPMKPTGLKERGVIWYQDRDGDTVRFVPHVFQVDNPGWHDAVIGDVDQDGDIDIVSKVWHADTTIYHADYWRNDTPQN